MAQGRSGLEDLPAEPERRPPSSDSSERAAPLIHVRMWQILLQKSVDDFREQ
jgi:hypothetical protein